MNEHGWCFESIKAEMGRALAALQKERTELRARGAKTTKGLDHQIEQLNGALACMGYKRPPEDPVFDGMTPD